VKSGQIVGLRPSSSRYQLAHPPAFHTVPASRLWSHRLNAALASSRTSTTPMPPSSISRRQSAMYRIWGSSLSSIV
jgi:hypothetical protein